MLCIVHKYIQNIDSLSIKITVNLLRKKLKSKGFLFRQLCCHHQALIKTEIAKSRHKLLSDAFLTTARVLTFYDHE